MASNSLLQVCKRGFSLSLITLGQSHTIELNRDGAVLLKHTYHQRGAAEAAFHALNNELSSAEPGKKFNLPKPAKPTPPQTSSDKPLPEMLFELLVGAAQFTGGVR